MLRISTKNIFLFLAVVGLLIFLHFTKILLPLERLVIIALNPIASKAYLIGSSLHNTHDNRIEKKDLLFMIDKLEQEVNRLTVEKAKLRNAEEENKKLRQYLKFNKDQEYKYVLADIISQGIFNSADGRDQTLIINKGEKNSVKPGLAVIDSQGIIIGKISKTKDYTAEVLLITNSDCKLAATIHNEEMTKGIVEGELGLTATMNFIPQTEKIEKGDIVVTSGLENNIKAGLVIGKVIMVDSKSNEVWQKASIESSIELDNLSIVSVLLP